MAHKYDEDHRWFYFFQSFKGWMCKICKMYSYCSEQFKGAYSARPWQNISHPFNAFKQYANSNFWQRLGRKLQGVVPLFYGQITTGFRKITFD